MISITGAQLYGFRPGNMSTEAGDADYAIPGDDLDGIEISHRAKELKDSASLTINNYKGRYSDVVGHGDRIALYVTGGAVSGGDEDNRWGMTSYGGGSYSSGYVHQWTGMIGPYENNAAGGAQYSIDVQAGDFVYEILGNRRHSGNYEGRKVAGYEDAILNQALSQEAPEIDRSEIPQIDYRTDLMSNDMYVLDILKELAARASFLPAAEGTKLKLQPTASITTALETGPGDGHFGPPQFGSNDDNLYNQIRVVGGSGKRVDDKQTDKTGYTTVTEDNRLTAQVQTEKARLAAVEVWTRLSGSNEGVAVRLQKDDGNGNPVDIDNSKKDLAKAELESRFLDDDGYTTFWLDDHYIPGSDPHIIIQSTGQDGQDIGVNGSGVPAFRAYYPFSVAVEEPAPDSIDEYRRRDEKIKDESISTFEGAEEQAQASKARLAQPDESISAPAYSENAHGLRLLDGVRLDDDMLGVHDDFVVVERSDEYDGSTLKSSYTMRSIDSI